MQENHPAQKEHSRKDNQRFHFRFAIRLRPTIASGFDLERHLSQEEQRAVTWTNMVLLWLNLCRDVIYVLYLFLF